MSDYDAYLAGDRTDDVALYLSESYVSDVDKLADRDDAERVEDVRESQSDSRSPSEAQSASEDGVVLVVEGERGRSVFQKITGMGAMDFGSAAMDNPGHVDSDLSGGDCPHADDGDEHSAQFAFSFAEPKNEEVGGLYAEGDVIHAYVYCSCGESYSDKWLAGER
ncbi:MULTISPECIES: DUF5807 family protein [Halobacterium]|uniref:DUF5807 family protein n=1 Tax=Halobacterium TaxID=2239 RepID=UPI00073E8E33|nr:DUF5807 family protein [Halobacterium sp. CBA1132]MCG1004581.1 DUF5807 family protein [Halobacterium noricense]